jgi:ATP-dependent 26S proteasome regulatory subunit
LTLVNDISNKRRYQSSAVAILETIDPLRYDEVIEAKYPLQKDPKWDFKKRVVWNLQTGDATDYTDPEHPEPFSSLADAEPLEVKLTKQLCQPGGTLLVIKWVISKTDTGLLSNWLLEWSQNKKVKLPYSTVLVLTSSLDFFPSEVLRWANAIVVAPATEEERAMQLRAMAEKLEGAVKARTDDKVKITNPASPDLINATRGLTLHDITNACYQSFGEHHDFRIEVFSDYKVKTILAAYKIRYIAPTFGFEAVQGYAYFKKYLRDRVLDPLVHADKYLAEGIVPPKGLMLYGPPGTGKTFMVHALGKESGLSVIVLDASDIMTSPLVGATETRVRQLIEIFESLAPVIVFIDEAEAILMNRDRINESTDSGVTSRMTTGLMSWLGSPDRKAFVVGATNYITKIDKAFLRVGRFDKTAMLLYPDFDSRLAILQAYSKNKKTVDVDWKKLATDTEMWNGAELSSLPVEAAVIRFNANQPAITQAHFETAMKQAFKVDVAARTKDMEQMIQSYKVYAPNYEPQLLEEAKKSLGQDKNLGDAIARGISEQVI